jgi:hypothetical protein
MAGARELQVTVAALVFTTREKDYGGVHLGVGAADAARLHQLLESISRCARPSLAEEEAHVAKAKTSDCNPG